MNRRQAIATMLCLPVAAKAAPALISRGGGAGGFELHGREMVLTGADFQNAISKAMLDACERASKQRFKRLSTEV